MAAHIQTVAVHAQIAEAKLPFLRIQILGGKDTGILARCGTVAAEGAVPSQSVPQILTHEAEPRNRPLVLPKLLRRIRFQIGYVNGGNIHAVLLNPRAVVNLAVQIVGRIRTQELIGPNKLLPGVIHEQIEGIQHGAHAVICPCQPYVNTVSRDLHVPRRSGIGTENTVGMLTQGILADGHDLPRELTEHFPTLAYIQKDVVGGIMGVEHETVHHRALSILLEGGVQLLGSHALVGISYSLDRLENAVIRVGNVDGIRGGGFVGGGGIAIATRRLTARGLGFNRVTHIGLSRHRCLLPRRRVGFGRTELVAAGAGGKYRRDGHKG